MTALELNSANVKCFFTSDFAVHFIFWNDIWKAKTKQGIKMVKKRHDNWPRVIRTNIKVKAKLSG